MTAPQRPASNSDARKRAEEKSRPITIRSDGFGNWEADCDSTCAAPLHLCSGDWPSAYEVALGHACRHHKAAS